MHLVVWGNFETDYRRRRSEYAIAEVFFPCFLLFSKYLWCIWWFGETFRRITGGGGVDMQSWPWSFLNFLLFFCCVYFVGWGTFETDDRRRIGDASGIFFLIFWVQRSLRQIIGGGEGEIQFLIFFFPFSFSSYFLIYLQSWDLARPLQPTVV